MRNTIKHLITLLVVGCAFTQGPALLASDAKPIIQVQTIDTHGNTTEYLRLVKAVIERQNEVIPGLPTRVYRTDWAGPNAGLVYVVVEFKGLAHMEEAIAQLGADAEWKRRVAEMTEKTGRTIVSSSLLRDVTP